MRDRRAFVAFMLAAAAASAGSVAAAPVKSSPANSGSKNDAPTDFVSQIDGPMTTVVGDDGRTWATWAYRAAGEFDVAVASRNAAGLWGAPSYLGRRDGFDEVEPAIAVDERGTVYVAFTTRGSGRVSVSALPAGASIWLQPVIVSIGGRAAAPVIRIFEDHVVVAYRTTAGIGLADLPVLSPAVIMGIQDGPDGVDPLGMVPKWGSGTKKEDGDPPLPVDE